MVGSLWMGGDGEGDEMKACGCHPALDARGWCDHHLRVTFLLGILLGLVIGIVL